MTSQSTAYEVEAALIDAYPGLLNIVAGHGSSERGSRHVAEIIADYRAEPFEATEPFILFSIGKYWGTRDTYTLVRGFWRVKKEEAY